eukprot:14485617-Ditylum_brightwellii.AAC.1
MNTLEERTIFVHLGDGKVIKFKECDDRLYYFDTGVPLAHPVGVTSNDGVLGYLFLQTIAKRLEYYSKQEIKGAEEAQHIQRILWWPNTRDYKSYVAHNLVHNSPVNVDDINRAEKAFGPAAPLFQGKMKCRTPPFGGKFKKLPLPLQLN